jgi:two-component system, OmpR family, phosphate regulon sensor histidine kinase PhoR
MAERLPSPIRVLELAAALALPTAVVFIVLILAGVLSLAIAIAAVVAVFLALILLAFLHLRHVRRLAERLDPAPGEAERPPSPLLPELDHSIITAQKRWRARLEEFEASLSGAESILANLPDPVLMLDADQRVTRANRAAETLLQEPLKGRALSVLLRHPELLGAVETALTERTSRKVEITIPVPVERSFSAHVEAVPRPLPDGTAAILLLHDVTALKRTDRMRADFVANASHELRTPLSTLIGFLETLIGAARDDAEARKRFLPIMLDQANRMARLVSDLLSLSRIELNEHTPPTGHVDVVGILRGIANALEMKAKSRGMNIRLDVEALPPVTGDADELAQVFQNLVDNAIKYGAPNTEVRIVARTSEDTSARVPRRIARGGVAISVIDHGEGIAREHLPRLTERFYRVDSARSHELGGTGLGLAIVKHIVNRHRGHLEIESMPGAGSRFTVYLRTAARQPVLSTAGSPG